MTIGDVVLAGVGAALAARHRRLIFHQSGGCCDGSSPMCYPDAMFMTGTGHVHLGALEVDG
ncbi:DUF779 domain-containing protein, partial [Curtobacterium sp. CT11-45]|uniref:DUF779 domain-containing protein n=1 Tax=Curtobacterium sp. CT11-45 TaxID=3243037 RepID=UPI0039B07096